MSRQASHDGFAHNLSVHEKNTLLTQAVSRDDFFENPLYEFASKVGPEVMDQLCNALAGEKIHIPSAVNFWQRLNCKIHTPQMIKEVFALVDNEQFTLWLAIDQVAKRYGASNSWLYNKVRGVRDDG